MIIINDKKKCSGCSACKNICPKKAISMREDGEGFKYPSVDKEKCINCQLCKKSCPILSDYKRTDTFSKPDAYAAWSLDIENKMQSSSGGIFTELSKIVLKYGGVVFGAGYDEHMNVVFKYIDNEQDLILLKGSKYVQCDVRNSFEKVKDFLKSKRKVLFVGTPCQVAGLYCYLGENYKNLYTIDLVCHGVPSPKIYRKYIFEIEKKYESQLSEIYFRDKTKGWKKFSMKCIFKDGKKYRKIAFDDVFIKGFLQNLYLRPSCYECKFNSIPRVADISLGDFWGIKDKDPTLDDDTGTSLVIVNSHKGLELYNKILNKIFFKKENLDFAIENNPCIVRSVDMPINRNNYFKDSERFTLDQLARKYYNKNNIIKNIIYRVMSKLLKKQ